MGVEVITLSSMFRGRDGGTKGSAAQLMGQGQREGLRRRTNGMWPRCPGHEGQAAAAPGSVVGFLAVLKGTFVCCLTLGALQAWSVSAYVLP